MIISGTQILNKKTNTIHIVDDIEVINNETLVFTKDIKCFPISEIERIEIRDTSLSYSESEPIVDFTSSLIQVLRNDLPRVQKPPSFLDKLLNRFF